MEKTKTKTQRMNEVFEKRGEDLLCLSYTKCEIRRVPVKLGCLQSVLGGELFWATAQLVLHASVSSKSPWCVYPRAVCLLRAG